MVTLEVSAIDVHVFCRESGQPLFLLLRRAPETRYAGQWRVVAGKLELDESPVRGAIRELLEETGLSPIGMWSMDYTHTYYDPVEERVKVIPAFAVETATMTVTLSAEHDASRWITFDQAYHMLRWRGQREGLRSVYEDIVSAPDRGAPFRIALA